jgi:hypothetical protein
MTALLPPVRGRFTPRSVTAFGQFLEWLVHRQPARREAAGRRWGGPPVEDIVALGLWVVVGQAAAKASVGVATVGQVAVIGGRVQRLIEFALVRRYGSNQRSAAIAFERDVLGLIHRALDLGYHPGISAPAAAWRQLRDGDDAPFRAAIAAPSQPVSGPLQSLVQAPSALFFTELMREAVGFRGEIDFVYRQLLRDVPAQRRGFDEPVSPALFTAESWDPMPLAFLSLDVDFPAMDAFERRGGLDRKTREVLASRFPEGSADAQAHGLAQVARELLVEWHARAVAEVVRPGDIGTQIAKLKFVYDRMVSVRDAGCGHPSHAANLGTVADVLAQLERQLDGLHRDELARINRDRVRQCLDAPALLQDRLDGNRVMRALALNEQLLAATSADATVAGAWVDRQLALAALSRRAGASLTAADLRRAEAQLVALPVTEIISRFKHVIESLDDADRVGAGRRFEPLVKLARARLQQRRGAAEVAAVPVRPKKRADAASR